MSDIATRIQTQLDAVRSDLNVMHKQRDELHLNLFESPEDAGLLSALEQTQVEIESHMRKIDALEGALAQAGRRTSAEAAAKLAEARRTAANEALAVAASNVKRAQRFQKLARDAFEALAEIDATNRRVAHLLRDAGLRGARFESLFARLVRLDDFDAQLGRLLEELDLRNRLIFPAPSNAFDIPDCDAAVDVNVDRLRVVLEGFFAEGSR